MTVAENVVFELKLDICYLNVTSADNRSNDDKKAYGWIRYIA